MIETFVESVFATVPERFPVADHFFSFGEDGYVELHCIKLLDQRKLNNKLKVIISPLSEISLNPNRLQFRFTAIR
jgi:hypothetical protein